MSAEIPNPAVRRCSNAGPELLFDPLDHDAALLDDVTDALEAEGLAVETRYRGDHLRVMEVTRA